MAFTQRRHGNVGHFQRLRAARHSDLYRFHGCHFQDKVRGRRRPVLLAPRSQDAGGADLVLEPAVQPVAFRERVHAVLTSVNESAVAMKSTAAKLVEASAGALQRAEEAGGTSNEACANVETVAAAGAQ